MGAVAEIGDLTQDFHASIEPGDLLVLHSDGITESMNSAGTQFGLESLVAILEKNQNKPPQTICERVIEAASAWSSGQIDDLTILVARYLGDEPVTNETK